MGIEKLTSIELETTEETKTIARIEREAIENGSISDKDMAELLLSNLSKTEKRLLENWGKMVKLEKDRTGLTIEIGVDLEELKIARQNLAEKFPKKATNSSQIDEVEKKIRIYMDRRNEEIAENGF